MRVSNAISNQIEVLGISGEHLFWTDEDQAREFVKEGKAHVIRRKRRVPVLQAVVELKKPGEVDQLGLGTALDRTRYSHRHETEDNPANVWMLVRQAHLAPFMRVLVDCMA